MQIFGNILIAIVFGIIALLGMKKIRQSILVIIFTFFLSLLLSQKKCTLTACYSVSNYFNKDSELNYKFRDLALFFETGADIKDNTTTTGTRLERYPILMETFAKSPLFGCYFFSDDSGNGYNSCRSTSVLDE